VIQQAIPSCLAADVDTVREQAFPTRLLHPFVRWRMLKRSRGSSVGQLHGSYSLDVVLVDHTSAYAFVVLGQSCSRPPYPPE
jgi:hypothetical protein